MYRLLTHNDLDGVGCGILAKCAFKDDVTIRYNSISGLNREVEWFLEHGDKEEQLFITDLSVNEENESRLNLFTEEGGSVNLIDHHKTSLHLNEHSWGNVTVKYPDERLTSATSLFYDYLTEEELLQPSSAIKEFVELVRQYDTWEWEKNENRAAKRLNDLFYLISIDEFEEKMVSRLSSEESFFFDDFEEKILEMEEKKIERYLRRKKREIVQTQIGGHVAGVVYAESYHSELGNELGKVHPHLDYIAILNIGGRRMGFRTIHDSVDVSEVAGQFGGGGHAKASGSSLTAEAYQYFVEKTFHLQAIKEDPQHNSYNLKETSKGVLYVDETGHSYFIYEVQENQWKVLKNHHDFKEFQSFSDAERSLKREHRAWLAKDEQFVDYLLHEFLHGKRH
ncbi:oligoribonuclease [Bacillus lacus]|uniref:Oligoribonuclease n=1 Tax=Metabacillus lacus TaxID=1983721 RepID=A0A7X2LY74_9BACI|nr:oligoribonuclease [Metabacillus lacus]MRX71498.1 oligoribonuclease [Metabacillus lacus]